MPGHVFSERKNKKFFVFRILLIIVWCGILLFCFLNRKSLSVKGILQYTPENLWKAAAFMLLFFALKSVSLFVYSGILYAVSGIIFPLPAAVGINICGSLIMLSLPYLIGMKTGASIVGRIRERYPKTERLRKLCNKNDIFFCFAARIIKIPSDIVSLYMGAAGVNYKKYLLGSILGTIPHTITYPVMGMSVSDITSPQFLLAFGAEVVYFITTAFIYAGWRKKHAL